MRQEPICDYEWSMFWLVPIKTRSFKTVREIRVYLWCSWDWLHGRWRRHVFMFPRFTCVSDIVCRPSCWSVRTQLSWPGPPPSSTITRPVIGPLFLSFITHRWLRHKTDSEMPRAAPTASYYIYSSTLRYRWDYTESRTKAYTNSTTRRYSVVVSFRPISPLLVWSARVLGELKADFGILGAIFIYYCFRFDPLSSFFTVRGHSKTNYKLGFD